MRGFPIVLENTMENEGIWSRLHNSVEGRVAPMDDDPNGFGRLPRLRTTGGSA